MRPKVLAVLVLAASAARPAAQAPGVKVAPMLDNATVAVERVRLAPGAAQPPHTHVYAELLVILSRGELEMHAGAARSKEHRSPGDVEFVKAGVSHFGVNAGDGPLDVMTVAIKADRTHGGTSPLPQPMPGVTRKSVLDNAELSVTRFEFEPDAREPVPTHPYDLLVVPTTAARLDVQLGAKKEVRSYAVGEAIFVPRSVPHAVANVGTASFQVLGIAIK
jgi:quercetin dioxygenase-like cupin family protein